MRLLRISIFLIAFGCVIQETEFEGKACSEIHACMGGWFCQQGVCVREGGVLGNDSGYPEPDSCATAAAPVISSFESPSRTSNTVFLSWAAGSTGTAISSWQLFRNDQQLAVVTGTTLSYSDLSVQPVTAYSYRLEGMDVCTRRAVRQLEVLTPANTPATVVLLRPTPGSNYAAPASFLLEADPTPESGASVTQVQFFRSGTLLCTATSAPFQCTASGVPDGTHSLQAVLTTSSGASASSSPVSITASDPPSVSITSPAAGTSFTAPSSITLQASAAAGTGRTVISVEFRSGTTVLCTDTTSPYTCVWSNPPGGTHSLTARVTDSADAMVTSAARSISVQQLIALSDDFNNNSLDSTRWSTYSQGDAAPREANQQLEIALSVTSGRYAGVSSAATVDFTNRAAIVQLKQAPSPSSPHIVFTKVHAGASASTFFDMAVSNGTLSCTRSANGTPTNLGQVSYNATSMAWLRFRESGGVLYSEYASGPSGPWTLLASTTNFFPSATLFFEMGGGTTATASASFTAVFDNLNVLNP